MEQNRDPRNRLTQIQSSELKEARPSHIERKIFPTNGAGITGYPLTKEGWGGGEKGEGEEREEEQEEEKGGKKKKII